MSGRRAFSTQADMAMARTSASASSWGFEEGEEIVPGRYAIRHLGGGIRFEAYLAFDDALHALVVAKIVRRDLVSDKGALAGLSREARALGELAHPALVRAFDADLAGPRPHLVLEHLEGPRLSSQARRDGITVEQLLPLALQLCSVLHYLAGRGWVHLDVKPRNVILSGQPKLIDLSVARPIDDARAAGGGIGTIGYMAPEQIDDRSSRHLGPPADVWGLCATLYRSAEGRLPFPPGPSEASGDERHPQLGGQPPPPPQRLPRELAEAILAGLRPEPEDRPTARELADSLEPVVADLPRPRLGLLRPGGRRRFARLS